MKRTWWYLNRISYISLADLLYRIRWKLKQKFHYTYDFGDCWEHQIVLEKILSDENVFMNPVCIAGALSCPPEDCGSIFGYYRLLAIKKNKKLAGHTTKMEVTL